MQRSAITPYEGTKPYIFVSYAHKDSDRVMRILEKLDERGYRIWYDDGIAPGSEWPENIAQHLNGCYLTLAFISPNSIASDNCRREITFALSKKKAFLAVILEESEMPLGMEMQLSAQQCVMGHGYRSEEKLLDKICACPDLEPCQELPPEAPVEAPETLPKEVKPADIPRKKPAKQEKKASKKKWPILAAAAATIVLVAVLVSSMTHVRITEDKKVSLSEDYLSVGYETVTRDMVLKINRLKKLTDLSFRNCDFESGALEALQLPKELRGFTVSDCTGVDDLSFLADGEGLTSLNLQNCGLKDELLLSMPLGKLRTVKLSGNPGFTDLQKISGWTAVTDLDISDTGIKSLDGLSCEKLMVIDFSGTAVSDAAALAAFSELATIRGSDTAVSSLEGLTGLTELKTLEFNNCAISSAQTPFAALRLVHLYLENNGLTDISGFENCTLLRTVHLAGNQISDIAFLTKNVQTLESLTLSGNPLEEDDLGFLSRCVAVTELELDGIAMSDLDLITPMYGITRLSAVDCGITDISGIQNCTNLKWLRLANNQVADISALKNLTVLKTLDLANNPVQNLASLPENYYAVLSLLGVPAKLETLSAVKGDAIVLHYAGSIANTTVAQRTFGRYYLLDCPTDKKVAMEDLLGSRLRFISSAEEIVAYMAEHKLDYSFLENAKQDEPAV